MKIKPLFVVLAGVFSLAQGCRAPLQVRSLETGIAAALEDRWDEAVALWQQALSGSPSAAAAARNNLAVAFERKGAWEEARGQYEAALALDPGNPTIRENFERFKLRLEAFRGIGR